MRFAAFYRFETVMDVGNTDISTRYFRFAGDTARMMHEAWFRAAIACYRQRSLA
jgi:hypothetical protein